MNFFKVYLCTLSIAFVSGICDLLFMMCILPCNDICDITESTLNLRMISATLVSVLSFLQHLILIWFLDVHIVLIDLTPALMV